jgi:hypothetical protein
LRDQPRTVGHPSFDMPKSVHSHAMFPPHFEHRDPSLGFVPSLWFCTTSMASAALPVVGLLHPTAEPGVRCVSRARSPNPTRRSAHSMRAWSRVEARGFPQRESHPSKNSPPRQPHCVTAAVTCLPFLRLPGVPPSKSPWCWTSLPMLNTLSFRGLCSPSRPSFDSASCLAQ